MVRRAAISLILCALILAGRAQAADNKVEETGAYTDGAASDALKKVLEPKGWKVTLSDGAYCEIWLRSGVPTGNTDASGAVYTWIGESTLIGVITFEKPTTDFRGQAIKPGSYTVRYEVHPTDGNHMGISPIRDFLVMLPVTMDPNPDATFKFEELTKMSTKVTGTNHPGVLSLVQLDSAPAAPKLESDESNHVIFTGAIKNAPGASKPIAFIVKGRAEQ